VPDDGAVKTTQSDGTQCSVNGDASSTASPRNVSLCPNEPYLILNYGSATGITLVSRS